MSILYKLRKQIGINTGEKAESRLINGFGLHSKKVPFLGDRPGQSIRISKAAFFYNIERETS